MACCRRVVLGTPWPSVRSRAGVRSSPGAPGSYGYCSTSGIRAPTSTGSRRQPVDRCRSAHAEYQGPPFGLRCDPEARPGDHGLQLPAATRWTWTHLHTPLLIAAA
jgi:hypothetical protein